MVQKYPAPTKQNPHPKTTPVVVAVYELSNDKSPNKNIAQQIDSTLKVLLKNNRGKEAIAMNNPTETTDSNERLMCVLYSNHRTKDLPFVE